MTAMGAAGAGQMGDIKNQQQVDGGDSVPLLHSSETPPGVFPPAPRSPKIRTWNCWSEGDKVDQSISAMETG